MGGRSAVEKLNSSDTESIRAEQAIFTSIRSPMGEGYRIIAASPGILPDERVEIVRRAPSHDSLCESDQPAIGLLAFPFNSGRYCVGFICQAGREHTARGGNRVYSHFAVVEPSDWQLFEFNAVRLHSALRHAIGSPVLTPPPMLGALTLARSAARKVIDDPPEFDKHQSIESKIHLAKQIARIELAMLRQGNAIVMSGADSIRLLLLALIGMPATLRRSLNVSTGLRHSPARRLQLCIVSDRRETIWRATQGCKIECLDFRRSVELPESAYDSWLGFIMENLKKGRANQLDGVTSKMLHSLSAEELAAIASRPAEAVV